MTKKIQKTKRKLKTKRNIDSLRRRRTREDNWCLRKVYSKVIKMHKEKKAINCQLEKEIILEYRTLKALPSQVKFLNRCRTMILFLLKQNGLDCQAQP